MNRGVILLASTSIVIGLAGCATTNVPVTGRSYDVLKTSQIALASNGFDVKSVDVDKGTITLSVQNTRGKFTEADRLDVRVMPFGDAEVRQRSIRLDAYCTDAMFLPAWTGRDSGRERLVESRAEEILRSAFGVAASGEPPAMGAVKGSGTPK